VDELDQFAGRAESYSCKKYSVCQGAVLTRLALTGAREAASGKEAVAPLATGTLSQL